MKGPVAVWSGSFRLFGVDVKCHTLSDGRRIVEAASLEALIAAMGNPEAPLDTDADAFATWQRGEPAVTNEIPDRGPIC